MFTFEIADIPVAVDNHFMLVEKRCEAFLTDKPPLFTVSAPEEEIFREDGRPSAYAEYLSILRHLSLALMEYDAFLMHAAVIDVDGQGVAFAAKSGTGKTTRMMLWKNAMGDRVKVINGDKPILRFMEDGLYAFGTPWRGKENLGGNVRVRMSHVCFIERGENVSLRFLEQDEVISRLFHQTLVPKVPAQLDRYMILMERFIQTVPFCLLRCNREKEDPEAVWARMKGQTI